MNNNKIKKIVGGGLAAVALIGGGVFATSGVSAQAFADDSVATDTTVISQPVATQVASAVTGEFGGAAPTLKAATKEQFWADEDLINAGQNVIPVFNTRDIKVAEDLVKEFQPDAHGITHIYTFEQAWYGVRVFFTTSGVSDEAPVTLSADPSNNWDKYAAENPQEAAWVAERYPQVAHN